MNELVHKGLVLGVPVKSFHLPDDCVPCKKGKQTKKSHKSKSQYPIKIPLELLHMDLFGPVHVESIARDRYCYVVTDEYSRYSWVIFLREKSETFECFKVLVTKLESLYNLKVRRIRSDNGTEFKNTLMNEFCKERGIHHEFSAPYTPQMNGVAERKNRTLIETARTMLADAQLPVQFWNEAIANACYTLNRVLVVKRHGKTCYELLHLRKPNLQFLEPFGAPCTMLKKTATGKFNEKVEVGIFLGYSTPCKRVYNKGTGNVEEWYEVDVQKYSLEPPGKGHAWMFDYQGLFDSFNLSPEHSDEEIAVQMMYDAQNAPDGQASPSLDHSHEDSEISEDESNQELVNQVESPDNEQNVNPDITNLDSSVTVPAHPVTRINKDHSQDKIIGDLDLGVRTRNQWSATYAEIM